MLGVTAISNDGSHVYFVAEGVLAPTTTRTAASRPVDGSAEPVRVRHDGARRQRDDVHRDAVAVRRPELHARTAPPTGSGAVLTAEPDIDRPAVPTPDGTVLVFDSSANLTNQNPSAGDLVSVDDPDRRRNVRATPRSRSRARRASTQYRTIYIQNGTGSQAVGDREHPERTTLDLRRLDQRPLALATRSPSSRPSRSTATATPPTAR